MTFAELMGAIRSSYAQVLAEAVAEHAPALREAALRHADGTLKADGQPPLPHRFDAFHADGVNRMVDSERQLRFDPFSFPIDGMTVSVAPFTWDWLDLEIAGDPAVAGAACRAWFLRWFDEQDENEPDADGLRGVVHYMSDPLAVQDGIGLRIDLGSAPDEALDDLLFALADAGIGAVRLRA